jgi:hypothetical protein
VVPAPQVEAAHDRQVRGRAGGRDLAVELVATARFALKPMIARSLFDA